MVVFVVNVQDFAYEIPMIKIKYAGDSMVEALNRFQKEVDKDDPHLRITLDAVDEGTFVNRMKTVDNKSK